MTERRVVLPILDEGTTPIEARIEPPGIDLVVLPGRVAYVIAEGPPDGALAIDRTGEKMTVRGWAGAQVALMEPRHANIDTDAGACMRRIGDALARATPAHRTSFAALVASRHERELGEDADTRPREGAATPRELVEALWAAAMGDPLTPGAAGTLSAQLEEVAPLVDPDRMGAACVYRALGVLDEALRCAAGVPPTGPVELALAALAASADLPPRGEADVREKLRARWSWERVQAEARWLGVVAETLAMLPAIGVAAVDALARASGRTVSASPNVPPPRAPAPPPVRTSPAPAREVRLNVGGKALAFIEVEGKRYRAELDGTPRPIRTRISRGDVHEGQGGLSEATTSAWVEGEVADVAPLLACLAHADVEKTQSSGKLTLSTSEQWGHFRQNRWTTVTVSIANDGAIEVDTAIATQDDSYY